MARRKSTTAVPDNTGAAPAQSAPEPQDQERVTLVGRLCADPVLRHTKSGKSVTTIRLAVNVPDAEATFWSVVIWNRTAEVVCEFLRKGRAIEVVGRTQQRSYETADGTSRDVTEIVASRVQFLGRPAASQSAGDDAEVA